MKELQAIGQIYEDYLVTIRGSWQSLIEDVKPKQTQCGPVYELENPLGRSEESFAIADMRQGAMALPHAHTNNESEIYLVLQGEGTTVVGGFPLALHIGSMAITPPDTAHFTKPEDDLVLAVINTPVFSADNVVDLDTNQDYPEYNFSANQYASLVQSADKS